ncbi:MAG: hypothetical protein Kow00128_10170 [Deltaproteobacteria bacterium]
MDEAPNTDVGPDIGGLILALSKAFHWAGLYGTDHPVLAQRAEETCARLRTVLDAEPGGSLLLGIARDKVLYRDRFHGASQELVAHLTESLYLRQVATLRFDPEVRPEDLVSLFRYLHESRTAANPVPPEEFVEREGIRGILLSPYNYKEMLSRTLVEPAGRPAEGTNREEELWRILLSADLSADRNAEAGIFQEITDNPDLFRAVLARARKSEAGGSPSAPAPKPSPISGGILARILRKTGELLRTLPPDRRREILDALDREMDPGGGTDAAGNPADLLMARSLTEEFSDDEFLDIFASILSIEGKAGGRIRTAFEILAVDRNRDGALAEQARRRRRESRKAKEYYDRKTWETIERLLLTRSEAGYLGSDHARFLESISAARKTYAARLSAAAPPDPSLAASLEPERLRERLRQIHLDLLSREPEEGEFLDLLEEIRKAIPNIISRGRIPLLLQILRRLETIGRDAPASRTAAVQDVIGATDFGQVLDLALSGALPEDQAEALPELLSEFARQATRQVLERLLTEPEAGKRKVLLRLAARLGPPAVPEMIERLSHPKWFYVRNLCLLLGEIGDRRAVPGLLTALTHTDSRVKREALQALGKLGAPEAVPALGKILTEEGFFTSGKEDPVRIDAANALYRIGGTEAFGFLHRGKKARRSAVRAHCEQLLRSVEKIR